MQIWARQGFGIRQGALDTLGKHLFPPWERSDTMFTSRPVTRWQITQYLFQATCLQVGGDVFGRRFVGETVLDTAETRTRSSLKPVEKGDFRKQKTRLAANRGMATSP